MVLNLQVHSVYAQGVSWWPARENRGGMRDFIPAGPAELVWLVDGVSSLRIFVGELVCCLCLNLDAIAQRTQTNGLQHQVSWIWVNGSTTHGPWVLTEYDRSQPGITYRTSGAAAAAKSRFTLVVSVLVLVSNSRLHHAGGSRGRWPPCSDG